MLWLLVLMWCPLAGTSADRELSKEMTGILGESATFSLESPSQIRDAVWGGNSLKVATLKWGPPCQLEPGDAYTSRDMTVSSDCRSLTIGDLCEEDSGEYMALFATVDNRLSTQNVTLKVYKCLSEADLEVFCGKEILGDGNKTLHLICSAGKWEDGVEFSWTSASWSGNNVSSSERSLVLLSNPQEDDVNVTCMVENPIGNASRTVSLKQSCAAGFYTEGKSPKEVIGVLGESATFPLETPSLFDQVLWLRNDIQVATLRRGPPCQLTIYGAYTKRDVTASQDCSLLTVRDLHKEDLVGYRVLMNHGKDIRSQTFILQVYKRLSETDLEVVCAKEVLSNRNDIFSLSCSAGKQGDGMKFSWTSPTKTGILFSPEKSLLLLHKPQEDDGNVTCMAKNPISYASRTVSLKQACAGLPKEVIGILGESASFLLESQSPFNKVLWFSNEKLVASLRRAPPPCQLSRYGPYNSREVTISPNCSSLTITDLRKEDSAEYRAQMQDSSSGVIGSQTFTLKVYKRLSEDDLNVVCAKEILTNGNKMLHLNCSVGKWEDGMEFSWTSPTKTSVFSSSKKSLLLLYKPQEDDANVTCTAENPVGNASRTVSLKQACAGNTDCSSGLTRLTIGISLAALVVAKVIVSACVFTRWPPCMKKRENVSSLASFARAQEEEGTCQAALNRRDLCSEEEVQLKI